MTTAGPGVGNTAAGMMEAASMSVPVVHIGGAVAMAKRDTGDLQDMSSLLLMESVSNAVAELSDFLKPSVDADNGRGDPCVVESILFGPVEPHRQVEASVRGG